jgi:hypothetical protein
MYHRHETLDPIHKEYNHLVATEIFSRECQVHCTLKQTIQPPPPAPQMKASTHLRSVMFLTCFEKIVWHEIMPIKQMNVIIYRNIFSKTKLLTFHVKWVPFHHGMARPQFAD